MRNALATFISAAVIIITFLSSGHAAPYAYVTNTNDNTVTVIDTATHTVVGAPIAVGYGPAGMGISPDGKYVYVSNEDVSTVSVIDTETNTVVGSPISVGSAPCGIAVAAGGNKAFVANCLGGTVSIIDTASRTVSETTAVISSNLFDIAASPNGSYVYVTDLANGRIVTLNAATNELSHTTTGDLTHKPKGVTVSPDGASIWVTRTGWVNEVAALNASTYSAIDTIDVNPNPSGIAVNPAGTKVYATSYGSTGNGSTVAVIKTSDYSLESTVTVGTAPEGVAVTPDGAYIYVVNSGSNTVSVINASNNTVVNTISVGSNPKMVRIQPASGTYVAVTANATGSATGSVSSNPAGINYSYNTKNTGSAYFRTGSTVVLYAIADEDAVVTWNNTCALAGGTESDNDTEQATCTIASMNTGKTVTATFKGTAYFSGTPKAGIAPLTVAFTDKSTNSPTSWLWDFGDGATSTSQNPSHTYTTKGYFDVTLTATGPDGPMTRTRYCYINSCYNYPVIISETSTGYTSILSGYTALLEGQTARIHAALFNENLALTLDKAIRLHGGYDCDYTNDSGFTVIKGSLTVSAGSVIIDQIKIK